MAADNKRKFRFLRFALLLVLALGAGSTFLLMQEPAEGGFLETVYAQIRAYKTPGELLREGIKTEYGSQAGHIIFQRHEVLKRGDTATAKSLLAKLQQLPAEEFINRGRDNVTIGSTIGTDDSEALEIILKKLNPDTVNFECPRTLNYLLTKNDPRLISFLRQKTTSHCPEKSLHLAVHDKSEDLVKKLLALEKFNLNTVGERGETAVQVAYRSKQKTILAALLDAGAEGRFSRRLQLLRADTRRIPGRERQRSNRVD